MRWTTWAGLTGAAVIVAVLVFGLGDNKRVSSRRPAANSATSVTTVPVAPSVVAAVIRRTFKEHAVQMDLNSRKGPVIESSHGEGILFGHLSTSTTTNTVTAGGHRVTFTGESRVVGEKFYVRVPKEAAQQFGNPPTPWVVVHVADRPDL